MALSTEETERYQRQILLPQIGNLGQEKLKHAKVLMVGTGGLGAPASLYLAAAGVGSIGIIDDDVVDISNLQRQILYKTTDAGLKKVAVAKERLTALNPNIAIEIFDERLSMHNVSSLIERFHVVIDGSDNFTTRYLVNDACYFLKKPLIHGSVFRFCGQATVFNVDDGPCYRCVFLNPPAPHTFPNCQEAGVLGPITGVIGSIQALEAIKLIVGIKESLSKRLMLFDALAMSFNEVLLPKNPECPLCGINPAIFDLKEEAYICGVKEISLSEMRVMGTDIFLLDVREAKEYQKHNLGGYLIPLGQLAERLDEIPKSKTIVVHCASGKRSAIACRILQEEGFNHVYNVRI